MLVTEEFKDLKTSYGTMRVHIFTPTMPGWTAKPKFPAVLAWSEIFNVGRILEGLEKGDASTRHLT